MSSIVCFVRDLSFSMAWVILAVLLEQGDWHDGSSVRDGMQFVCLHRSNLDQFGEDNLSMAAFVKIPQFQTVRRVAAVWLGNIWCCVNK